MKCFLKHLKPIAYLLTALILLQSCVVYKSKPITLKQATEIHDRIIKIKTVDGKKHKFRWIEENEGNVLSIKQTKKTSVEISDIKKIKVSDPKLLGMTLDSTRTYIGMMTIKTKLKEYDFIKIEVFKDKILGTAITSKDTTTVIIPKNQIMKIESQNKAKSTLGNVFISIGVIFVCLIFTSMDIGY